MLHDPGDEGTPFRAWRLRCLDPEAFAALDVQQRLRWLAGWALLAPTTHNTVPQRFDLRDDALALWIDRRAVLTESDPTGRQATISVGCAVENVVLAAAACGLAATLTLADRDAVRPLVATESPLAHVATLRFAPGGDVARRSVLDAMRRRKVVRAEYDERVALDPKLAEDLRARVRGLHGGLALHLISDAPTRMLVGKLQEQADSTVINRPAFARELGEWLLPNDSGAAVGMRGREFGLSDAAAARMHRGLLGDDRLLPDETAAFAKAGNLGMRSSSAVAVVTAARDDLEHRLAAGRAYQGVALALLEAGFCTAVHAGITEVAASSMALRGRLRTTGRPMVVFRVGVPLHSADGERPHSARPPLEDLILEPRDL